MGLFGKMFEKKICSVCGGEIKLLGNRKLEDGNLCKECASKLSPFFSDRRRSTVSDIKAQLEYREKNKDAVAAFNATAVFGRDTKVIVDEANKKFMVTSARNYAEANPDVIDFKDVLGVNIEISEETTEETYEDKEGNTRSYRPPRYYYTYDFEVHINVRNPYFDTMTVKLNSSSVELNPDRAVAADRKPDPQKHMEYREYKAMANDIKRLLTNAREEVKAEREAANAFRAPVVCKCCGATTTPDVNGCCEFCGGMAQ